MSERKKKQPLLIEVMVEKSSLKNIVAAMMHTIGGPIKPDKPVMDVAENDSRFIREQARRAKKFRQN